MPDECILVTENTVIDALHSIAARPFDYQTLDLNADHETLILVTVHRRENFGTAKEYRRMAHAVNPYGNGCAAQRIVHTLLGDSVMPFVPR